MSNDFLRAYTIPLLPEKATSMEITVPLVGTPLQAEEHMITSLAPQTNINRYFPPGKQDPNGQISPSKPPQPARPLKRKLETPTYTGCDASYPNELKKLIQPLLCSLCNVQLNSPRSAKDHYESKAHDKKLTAWIDHNYPENPPPIKRFFHETQQGEGGEYALHCKLCDLKFTSLVHAKQHYSGRKHKNVANNVSNPSGAGYYDKGGKWIRTSTKVTPVIDLTDSRFGIGLDFQQNEANENAESSTKEETNQSEDITSAQQPPPAAVAAAIPKDESLYCKVCKISVTSASQMQTHLEGARHRKSLARLSIDPGADPVTSTKSNDTIMNSIKSPLSVSKIDDEKYSMYRTPSGSYYCQLCNTSVSSVTTLEQHIQGKRHKKIANEQKLKEEKAN